MACVFLMGIGSGDWLPMLAMLVGLGALVQCIDMTVKYIRMRRRRKLEMMQRAFEEVMQIDQNLDIDAADQ